MQKLPDFQNLIHIILKSEQRAYYLCRVVEISGNRSLPEVTNKPMSAINWNCFTILKLLYIYSVALYHNNYVITLPFFPQICNLT